MPKSDNEGRGGSDTTEDVGTGFIEPIEIQEEMERSFLEYSMSVIVSRALPDVRDGLKPVHRRILYSMYDQRLLPDRPHSKCAKVVGDVMGSYHPHGDSAIYEALARMVQDFSLRHPLIDGHGNFGGTGPDEGPAAMRYTECRLGSLALELMSGIDQETVDFTANYDATSEEPTVLPSRFPNMLVNGSQGIAVGMATNIPPHNLGEVIDATTHLLEHPEATPDDLMEFIKGPDFPTGALILGRQGILDAMRTGRGSIKLRAVAEIDDGRDGATRIVITEMPYQTSIASVSKKIEDLVRAGDLDGIAEAQDDSSGGKTRLVIRLKRDANANVVLNNLFKQTPMQTTFSVNAVALVDGVPRTLNVAQMLTHYVAHQVEVVTRRSEFLLKKARDRAHVVEGLLKAIDMLDQVIATIRGSDDRPAALEALCATPFDFSEEQANHILDMTLARLTRLGRTNLEEEMAKLLEEIAELESILNDPAKLRRVIAGELGEIREKFANERRTVITHDPGDMNVEDLVDDEELVVTLSRAGYVKAVSADAFRTQARGGRGRAGGEAEGGGPDRRRGAHVVARPPPALLEPRPGLPPAGSRDPDEGAHGPGDGHRQPPAAVAQRDDPGHRRDPGLPDRQLPGVRHQARADQEDRLQRVRQVAARGLHRHQPAGRRRAGPGGRDPRGRRRLHRHLLGHDDPVLRAGRPLHGPRRGRRAGRAPQARGRGRVVRHRPGRGRHPDRDRRRLRKADEGRAVQPAGPRGPGRPGHQAHRQTRTGGGSVHGRPRRRAPTHFDVGRGHPDLRARDRQPGSRRHWRAGDEPRRGRRSRRSRSRRR